MAEDADRELNDKIFENVEAALKHLDYAGAHLAMARAGASGHHVALLLEVNVSTLRANQEILESLVKLIRNRQNGPSQLTGPATDGLHDGGGDLRDKGQDRDPESGG